jgi:1,4-dihydroxy-2-naphthoate octaprenyltransferase
MISILLLSVIPVCLTANIMLANNICDIEHDIKVKRYTLPYYLGKHSLTLFSALYYATYAANVIMVILGVLHPITLIALVTFPFVQKNIRKFKEVQDKGTTFNLSIINYFIIIGANTLAVLLAGIIRGGF